MKKKLLFTFLFSLCSFLPSLAQYNNWAVGFQLVEPSGVNLRKYFGENKAFDVSVGTYGLFYGRDRKYRKGYYQNAGLSLRATYLWHHGLFKKELLHVYYGFGGQINSRRYYFESRNAPGLKEYTNNISLGGAGLAGAEYFVSGSPLSCFVEAGLYAELVPAIFYLHPQASLGVRFNF
ncbi:hypothetical protein P1X15_08350 [Runella sp. MFBS21]|uniref:hypothetical protein n=1 Tax=Runella sp. MFBS21 TaxID=3034018 RepID=UPI0023F9932A|nr:hypothetical protein [Runella sp. MFBS21]MDF7817603.1 hypothetical protein [Runella sp. MFBS21]